MPTLAEIDAELAREQQAEQTQAREAAQRYLDAVNRRAAGEVLTADEKRAILAAAGVTDVQFAEDVKLQIQRAEHRAKVDRKPEHQAALESAQRTERELVAENSRERAAMEARFDEKLAVPRQAAVDAKAALADISESEKFLDKTEGVSAIDPTPRRAIFATVTAVDESRGFMFVESAQTSPHGHDLYERFGQLPFGAASKDLIGRRIEVEWFKSEYGQKLRAVRVLEEPEQAPA